MLLAVALVVGQLLGQPVLVSYVRTGSMEPTIDAGDGFVPLPTAVTGPPEEGDVVTFRARQLQGGGLVTHRIVDRTDRGYVTRGDANPFTDQDGEEPPVKRTQIVAVAAEAGSGVVVIPELGTVVQAIGGALGTIQRYAAAYTGLRSLMGLTGVGYGLGLLSAIGYVVDVVTRSRRETDERDRTPDRDRGGTDGQRYLRVFTAIIVVAATGTMLLPSGPTEYGVVSAEFDSDQPSVIPAGETREQAVRLGNTGLVPVVAVLEPVGDGIGVRDRTVSIPSRGEATTEITITAPEETGYYRRVLTTHRYLALLPTPMIVGLAGVHPWLPVVVIDAVLGGGFYLLGYPLLAGRIRSRDRDDRRRSGTL
ncbi:S26 family signal peptidase [Halobaculum sp. MBLA0143]|uniref:S26 family signal peptidase n=1 Tax=Halobaculum sp. MBLA0143 TaxID=3079933 RepID=UPI0035236964